MLPSNSQTEAQQIFNYLSRLVAMADANRALMDGTMQPVRKIIEETDVVCAVWQDAKRPYGVGTLTIKGATLLRNVSANIVGVRCLVDAIPCDSLEQALALQNQGPKADVLN